MGKAAKSASKTEIKKIIIESNIADNYGKVFSNKYQCLITKATAYFDETLQDWLNDKIEENLTSRKNGN